MQSPRANSGLKSLFPYEVTFRSLSIYHPTTEPIFFMEQVPDEYCKISIMCSQKLGSWKIRYSIILFKHLLKEETNMSCSESINTLIIYIIYKVILLPIKFQ